MKLPSDFLTRLMRIALLSRLLSSWMCWLSGFWGVGGPGMTIGSFGTNLRVFFGTSTTFSLILAGVRILICGFGAMEVTFEIFGVCLRWMEGGSLTFSGSSLITSSRSAQSGSSFTFITSCIASNCSSSPCDSSASSKSSREICKASRAALKVETSLSGMSVVPK